MLNFTIQTRFKKNVSFVIFIINCNKSYLGPNGDYLCLDTKLTLDKVFNAHMSYYSLEASCDFG